MTLVIHNLNFPESQAISKVQEVGEEESVHGMLRLTPPPLPYTVQSLFHWPLHGRGLGPVPAPSPLVSLLARVTTSQFNYNRTPRILELERHFMWILNKISREAEEHP